MSNQNEIVLENITSINFCFENCEECTIYKNEIIEMELESNKELGFYDKAIFRKIKSGLIKFKVDEKFNINREVEFINFNKKT